MNEFLLNNAIWTVILSNGEKVISDNQYFHDHSDWYRLKFSCLENDLYIDKMWISFRDNVIEIPKAKHYFFRRMSLGRFGKNNRIKETFDFFLVGSTDDKKNVNIGYYQLPELYLKEKRDRILEDDEVSLI